MFKRHWRSCGATAIGPLHVTSGTPNQDSWLVHRFRGGSVAVVSDGLGSKPHSDHGSRVACRAVLNAAKYYRRNPSTDISEILSLIHYNWLKGVVPFHSSDCSATCLFAIRIGDEITLGRLGDGMIAVYGNTPDDSLVLSDDKDGSFSNYTSSLGQVVRAEHWDVVKISSESVKGIVLCTDGVSDDLIAEMRLPFVEGIYKTYARMGSRKCHYDIRRWLKEWPVPKHSDDKTIVCLFKKGV